MISAKTARDITDSNVAALNERLERIGMMIKHEAKNGKSLLVLDAATDVDGSFFKVDRESYHKSIYTAGQMLLKEHLENSFGYKVSIEAWERHDPCARREPRTVYNIVIRW
jgi:hypothetical protein